MSPKVGVAKVQPAGTVTIIHTLPDRFKTVPEEMCGNLLAKKSVKSYDFTINFILSTV